MIRLSKLTDYASVLLAVMAREPNALWTASALSERSNVPKPTCVKVLKQLTKHGLLISTQGPRGGYSLARPASQIPVKHMIEAIEGPMAMTECGTDEALCRLTDHCTVMAKWRELGQQVNDLLLAVTLQDLIHPHALPSAVPQRIKTLEIH